MFSFFRKKPSDEARPPADDAQGVAPVADASSPPATAADRPKTAMEWLNTDIGELFFGKKPVEPMPAPVDGPAPDAPVVRAPPAVGSDAASPVAPPEPSPAPVAPTQPSAQVRPPPTPSPTATPPTTTAAPAAARPGPPPEDRSDWLTKLRSGLRRTGSSIAQAFVGASVDDALYEDLEAALLQADAGVAATRHLLDDLQRRVKRAGARDPAAVRTLLLDAVAELLAPLERPLVIGEHVPTVIMVVGVNGAGKTTSVGKLARHLVDADQKVLLAAADTFRAAAREQLMAWAERAEPERDGAVPISGARGNRVEIVSQEGGDPASLAFDAVVAGRARGCDVVIADTAGRLATQAHLMEELKKIRRTIGKAERGAPHEVLLVIDGNTGQNALAQVQAFDAALQLTGLIITKLDGTAKGGVLAAIALWSRGRGTALPVYFVGVGEKLSDLQTFRADEFAQALLA